MEMNPGVENMEPLRTDIPTPTVTHLNLEYGICIECGMGKERIAAIRRRG